MRKAFGRCTGLHVDDDLRPQRVEQAEPIEQQEQRNEIGQDGRSESLSPRYARACGRGHSPPARTATRSAISVAGPVIAA
jgi:hypothetical protein